MMRRLIALWLKWRYEFGAISGPEHQQWLDQVQEDIIDPERPIIDAHHHLWHDFGIGSYLLDELGTDTGSGHNVVQTVFMECSTQYRKSGPRHLRPVGETEFVARLAAESRSRGQPDIAGIVGHGDLRLPTTLLEELVQEHRRAGAGLFKGVRQALVMQPEGSKTIRTLGAAPEPLHENPDFLRGVRKLGSLGLLYESWHYHVQNGAFLEVARAAPDTPVVLDHLGMPLGVDRWAEQPQLTFEDWKRGIAKIAQCDNTFIKLGGMAMPYNGFGWHRAQRPPSSDEFAAAQARFYLHAIECFGPERCLFESNFPMDRLSLSYPVFWNGVKKIVRDFSESEKNAMFSGTASRLYGL